MKISADAPLKGTVDAPGDKSISHRAAILGALAAGTTRVANFAPGKDPADTLKCLQALGVDIRRQNEELIIQGRSGQLQEPESVVDCGNSGTTMRLLMGVLSGQKFFTSVCGDESLSQRPMKRITDPMRRMGAEIRGRQRGTRAPLSIRGAALQAIKHRSEVASAQVKSAVLLAALYCQNPVSVTEPAQSRDHTERMLQSFGADVEITGNTVTIAGGSMHKLRARDETLKVPGDISSAAFLMAAALICPDSEICIKNVGINPTRDGVLRVFERMDAGIELKNRRKWGPEPVADIRVCHSQLQSVQVQPSEVASMIDEIPVLAALASRAEGVSRFCGVGELRVKETDRLSAIVDELSALGAEVEVDGDDLIVRGSSQFKSQTVDARGDHRMAMTLLVTGLPEGGLKVREASAIDVSYPTFPEDLSRLGAAVDAPPKEALTGLIGNPVSHSLSPVMFRAAFGTLNLNDWSYMRFGVESSDLSGAVQGMRKLKARGFNVTTPHKVAITDMLDQLDDTAQKAGAVNTVVIENDGTMTGYNTDILGVSRALQAQGVQPDGRKALLLGAGGAARAAAVSLAEGGITHLHIANRTRSKAAALADFVQNSYSGLSTSVSDLQDPPSDVDIVVQSTILGMSPHKDRCPLPSCFPLSGEMAVFEMIYNPTSTLLVRRAQRAGAKIILGSEMLVHQGARAFELWTGLSAPVDAMRRSLRRELRC